jgi:hypothetical protein
LLIKFIFRKELKAWEGLLQSLQKGEGLFAEHRASEFLSTVHRVQFVQEIHVLAPAATATPTTASSAAPVQSERWGDIVEAQERAFLLRFVCL